MLFTMILSSNALKSSIRERSLWKEPPKETIICASAGRSGKGENSAIDDKNNEVASITQLDESFDITSILNDFQIGGLLCLL